METIVKQPGETLKRQLVFPGGAALGAIVSVTAEARGLVAGSAPIGAAGELVAGMMFIDLDGGTDGERYLITAVADTAGGERLEAEMEVAVIDGQWVMPDGGAPYLTIAEFVAKFGLAEVVQMTDQDGSGRIDREYLVNALSDVQAVADAYIAARYTVPLAEVPQIVKVAIADMARARLYPRGAPDGVEAASKAGLALLDKISRGGLPLPSATPVAAGDSSDPILFTPGTRLYPDGLSRY